MLIWMLYVDMDVDVDGRFVDVSVYVHGNIYVNVLMSRGCSCV